MNVSPAIATNGKFSSRLPNSIHEFSSDCPLLSEANALDFVHLGQSGQPRPDEDSRTAAPVAMTTAFEIIAASAQPCSARTVGRNTGAIRRENTRTMRNAPFTCARSLRIRFGDGRVQPPVASPGAREAAADAATTQPMPIHSAGRRRWDKIARPMRAATAGCSDIQTPNSWAEIRRSASSSSQYGMAEERMPMAAPTARNSRAEHVPAARGDAGHGDHGGRHAHRHHQTGRAGHPLADALAADDVARPGGARATAQATPAQFRWPTALLASRTTPTAARAAQPRASARRPPARRRPARR